VDKRQEYFTRVIGSVLGSSDTKANSGRKGYSKPQNLGVAI
jgi:hypothetical protein